MAEECPVPQNPSDDKKDRIIKRSIEKEMKYSYIDYAMSVIVGRALPDVRDGLKPVHRRILYAMSELGNTYDKPYKKSARVVGEVLGKYHPHGDIALYDALVRMAQNFSLRYMLIDGQGNFGSVDGDPPAAMRYTECRISKIAGEMLDAIDEETVDFTPNFDGTLQEPVVMPSKLPNLLVNGSSGIAVGMATNVPPHNLREVVDALILLIEKPDSDTNTLMALVKGPDFPTGGIICGRAGIVEAYSTGKGVIRIRGKHHIEAKEKEKRRIIVTELPYQVNKAELLTNIANLVKEKTIDGITDLRDESDREGMRIVIELRRDALEEVVVNQLFSRTALETSFGIINLALVNNKPELLPLRNTLNHFLRHREEVVTRSIKFRLRKAEERAHIVEGLLIAVDHIDEVINIIRGSKTSDDARRSLEVKFSLSEIQSKAILDMKLSKLTGLEREALKEEDEELEKSIAEFKDILASKEKIDAIIKKELIELKEKYGDERKTEIIDMMDEIEIEDLIPIEDVVVTITNANYIKRLPLKTYSAQHRGGKGLIGMETKEEDFVVTLFVTSTHDYIMFFTNKGRCYWLKTYKIPDEGRYAKGRPIVNLLPKLEKDEDIESCIHVSEFDSKRFLIFATKKGTIKKTNLSAYGNPREKGIIAINLEEGDELVDTKLSDGEKEIVLATKHGLAARFHEKGVRPMGRTATGVIGVRLRKDDDVVSMTLVNQDSIMLTLTEKGYGKRTPVSLYRKTSRGAHGVITTKTGDKNGCVISVLEVAEDDEILLTSREGMVIRVPVKYISIMGRNVIGVRVMRLNDGDKVMAVSRLVSTAEQLDITDNAKSVEPPSDSQTGGIVGGGPSTDGQNGITH